MAKRQQSNHKVTVRLPVKQGLKLISGYDHVLFCKVTVRLPVKQGLKRLLEPQTEIIISVLQ